MVARETACGKKENSVPCTTQVLAVLFHLFADGGGGGGVCVDLQLPRCSQPGDESCFLGFGLRSPYTAAASVGLARLPYEMCGSVVGNRSKDFRFFF